MVQVQSYSVGLKRAVELSLKIGVMPPGWPVRTKNISDKRLSMWLGHLESLYNDLMMQGFVKGHIFRLACVQMSTIACLIMNRHKQQSLLTFGTVERMGEPLFKVDQERIISELVAEKPTEGDIGIHAWVTVGNRIIDPTIRPYLLKDIWLSGSPRNFIHSQKTSDEDGDYFKYRPMLCGEHVTERLFRANPSELDLLANLALGHMP